MGNFISRMCIKGEPESDVPEPTAAEIAKAAQKALNKLMRDHRTQIFRAEQEEKKAKKNLEKGVKKDAPRKELKAEATKI